MTRTQKKYYQKKIKGFERMIWDLELQRFSNSQLREKSREEYDDLMERKEAMTNDKKADKDRKAVVSKEIEDRLEQVKKEMDMFDIILNGNAEHEGVNNKIDTVRSTIVITKKFLNERR